MGFTTPSYSLTDLFARADRGELQLPDFQREYIWDFDRVRTLVTSVLRGYPIGALLALDTRNVAARFRSRVIHGAPDTGREPGLVLLDGQQRLTTLYHAFHGDGVVPTTDFLGHPIERRFFVDVVKAASADPMPVEAVFATDVDGVVCSHFGPQVEGPITTREVMISHGIIPVAELLRPEGNDLLFDMAVAPENTPYPKRIQAIKEFHNRVTNQLPAYTVPVIRVSRDTSLTGIGQIFAHANSAGVQMDVVELLSTLFALQDPEFAFPRHLAGLEERLRAHPVLDGVSRIDLLRAMSLVVTSRAGSALGHRGDILSLTLAEYRSSAEEIARAFEQAARFLEERCFLSPDQAPYPAQIVSLSAILARISEREDRGSGDLGRTGEDNLNQWFWCGMFGELYGGHAPTIRSGRDVDEVTPWVTGETDRVPGSVTDATFVQSRLLTAGPASSVYHALYALVIARGARDWRTGSLFTAETFADLEVRFNKVFPRAYCEARGVDSVVAESVLNRVPMGIKTKVLIEGNGPKRYMPRLQSKSLMDDAEFDAMLAGHQLDPQLLLASDHEGFFRDRLGRFSDIVEFSMGKPMLRDLNDTVIS
ncbi:DUF262 domain-containing protein [Corynebacterium sp. LK2510]|uniref:GmrSD restriction endonuclease domain-containing protein n=1 Tax=Corynebacterium sp. LK2510 TaxID=3110472 RepID=UPI0034CF03C5